MYFLFSSLDTIVIFFESESHSVVSDSLGPRGLQPTRLLCPWDSPGKKKQVAMPSSRGIFLTQGSNLPSLKSLLLWQAGSLPLAKDTINCSLETSEGLKQISLGSCFHSNCAASVLVYFGSSPFSSDSCTRFMRNVIYFRNTLWPWPNIHHYHLTLKDSPHAHKYLKTFLLQTDICHHRRFFILKSYLLNTKL